MRTNAGRLRISDENGIQVTRLAGSGKGQASNDAVEVVQRQSGRAHALGCGLKNRAEALLDP
jgi:hypothetical protein